MFVLPVLDLVVDGQLTLLQSLLQTVLFLAEDHRLLLQPVALQCGALVVAAVAHVQQHIRGVLALDQFQDAALALVEAAVAAVVVIAPVVEVAGEAVLHGGAELDVVRVDVVALEDLAHVVVLEDLVDGVVVAVRDDLRADVVLLCDGLQPAVELLVDAHVEQRQVELLLRHLPRVLQPLLPRVAQRHVVALAVRQEAVLLVLDHALW